MLADRAAINPRSTYQPSCNALVFTTRQRRLQSHRLARNRFRATQCTPVALLKVTETITGVEFPLVQRFWEGTEYRCLGAAPRLKKILFINAKVYAIALYVEASKAAKELKIRDRGDFFQDADPSAYCDAIMDGAFDKVLQITLVRDISPEQFLDAIEEAIGSKLRFIGASAVFEDFKQYMTSQEFKKGNIVLLHWSVAGYLDAVVVPEDITDYASAINGMKRFENAGFCRGFFELYMGSDTILPEAKEAWSIGARTLLDSTKI